MLGFDVLDQRLDAGRAGRLQVVAELGVPDVLADDHGAQHRDVSFEPRGVARLGHPRSVPLPGKLCAFRVRLVETRSLHGLEDAQVERVGDFSSHLEHGVAADGLAQHLRDQAHGVRASGVAMNEFFLVCPVAKRKRAFLGHHSTARGSGSQGANACFRDITRAPMAQVRKTQISVFLGHRSAACGPGSQNANACFWDTVLVLVAQGRKTQTRVFGTPLGRPGPTFIFCAQGAQTRVFGTPLDLVWVIYLPGGRLPSMRMECLN